MAEALLFPGQGSQEPGMGELVEAHAPELATLVRDALGRDPFELAGEGTVYAQPAIVCASIARWVAAGRPAAGAFAGHSLGELSALVAAGALAPADGARLALERGRLMQAAARRSPGAMVALLGDAATARDVAARAGLEVANDNGPTQLVVAGPVRAVEALPAAARAAGLRAIRLAVAGAFHTGAMNPARAAYRRALEAVELREPAAPVYSSSTAAPFPRGPAAVRDQLAAALVQPVRWRETMDALRAAGVDRFVEVGPGKALTGMVRRSLEGVEARMLELEDARV